MKRSEKTRFHPPLSLSPADENVNKWKRKTFGERTSRSESNGSTLLTGGAYFPRHLTRVAIVHGSCGETANENSHIILLPFPSPGERRLRFSLNFTQLEQKWRYRVGFFKSREKQKSLCLTFAFVRPCVVGVCRFCLLLSDVNELRGRIFVFRSVLIRFEL